MCRGNRQNLPRHIRCKSSVGWVEVQVVSDQRQDDVGTRRGGDGNVDGTDLADGEFGEEDGEGGRNNVDSGGTREFGQRQSEPIGLSTFHDIPRHIRVRRCGEEIASINGQIDVIVDAGSGVGESLIRHDGGEEEERRGEGEAFSVGLENDGGGEGGGDGDGEGG